MLYLLRRDGWFTRTC